MKKLEFERPAEALELSVVEEFERLIGAALPEEYRRFLLETNGGPPSSKNKRFLIKSNPEFIEGFNEVHVDRFYQLRGMTRPALSLREVFEMTLGRIPSGTIPIATDPMGNLFLLGIAGPLRDAVFFWDHEAEGFEEAGDKLQNIGQLSNSFESFVDALIELEPQRHS